MPTRISEAKRRDIEDAIRDGIPVTDIRALLSTSAGTITEIKRAMGIPIRPMKRPRTRTVAQVAPPAPTVMHHREIPPHSYLERVKELKRRGFTPSPEDITSEDEQPAPSQTYTPQEYFQAIATGLRERDEDNATLRQMVSRLETENRRLLSDLHQCKLQMASWTGPTALPGKSLGNGG